MKDLYYVKNDKVYGQGAAEIIKLGILQTIL